MLKVTQHYSENFRKCPIREIECTGEKFPLSASNVKRYCVKDPEKRELHDIFTKLAVAMFANGQPVDAATVGRLAIIIAQEAAKAGLADMEIDLRTEDDRTREREAAGGPVVKNFVK